MSDQVRDQILNSLSRILELMPELRFGQLANWISTLARPAEASPLANLDDEDFLEACQRCLADIERFHQDNESTPALDAEPLTRG